MGGVEDTVGGVEAGVCSVEAAVGVTEAEKSYMLGMLNEERYLGVTWACLQHVTLQLEVLRLDVAHEDPALFPQQPPHSFLNGNTEFTIVYKHHWLSIDHQFITNIINSKENVTFRNSILYCISVFVCI